MKGRAHPGHGIVKGACGHVIAQCRCIEGHKQVTTVEHDCDACEKAKAMDLDPYSPAPHVPRWPTL